MTAWYRIKLPAPEARWLARMDVEPGEVRYAGHGALLLDEHAVMAMGRRPEGDWSVTWREAVPVLHVGRDCYPLEAVVPDSQVTNR